MDRHGHRARQIFTIPLIPLKIRDWWLFNDAVGQVAVSTHVIPKGASFEQRA